MPSEQDNLKLMYGILQQQMKDGAFVNKIDWQVIANDLGLDSVGAASKRWGRLKAEILKGGPEPSTTEAGSSKVKTPKAKKTVTPKKKKEDDTTEKPKHTSKKRKAEDEDEELDEDTIKVEVPSDYDEDED